MVARPFCFRTSARFTSSARSGAVKSTHVLKGSTVIRIKREASSRYWQGAEQVQGDHFAWPASCEPLVSQISSQFSGLLRRLISSAPHLPHITGHRVPDGLVLLLTSSSGRSGPRCSFCTTAVRATWGSRASGALRHALARCFSSTTLHLLLSGPGWLAWPISVTVHHRRQSKTNTPRCSLRPIPGGSEWFPVPTGPPAVFLVRATSLPAAAPHPAKKVVSSPQHARHLLAGSTKALNPSWWHMLPEWHFVSHGVLRELLPLGRAREHLPQRCCHGLGPSDLGLETKGETLRPQDPAPNASRFAADVWQPQPGFGLFGPMWETSLPKHGSSGGPTELQCLEPGFHLFGRNVLRAIGRSKFPSSSRCDKTAAKPTIEAFLSIRRSPGFRMSHQHGIH